MIADDPLEGMWTVSGRLVHSDDMTQEDWEAIRVRLLARSRRADGAAAVIRTALTELDEGTEVGEAILAALESAGYAVVRVNPVDEIDRKLDAMEQTIKARHKEHQRALQQSIAAKLKSLEPARRK